MILCACAGWSEFKRFAPERKHFFVWLGPYDIYMMEMYIIYIHMQHTFVTRQFPISDKTFPCRPGK